jgi:hypothetical protein
VAGNENLPARLASAAMYIIRLRADNFPDKQTANACSKIREALTHRDPGPGDDGAIAAEPAGDSLKGLYELLAFNLEEGITLDDAMRITDLTNNKITSLTLTK